jgi:Ricin-type beta-trefoil lectin domain-like
LSGNVIDIQQASTKTGALLDAFPQKSSGTANQLWEFVADPAGSGCFFIVSQLNGNVIDIQGASTKAGVGLDAYPWKLTGYDNQLWTVVDGSFPSVVETVPVPPGGYSGSGNYILANGSSCATLTGVKATILFTEDLVWESQVVHPGFSIQLNAETNNNQTLDWLQFVVHMGDDQGLWPWINIWSGSNPQIVWDQSVANPVATMPQAQRIPKGYSIVIALQNDSERRVTGATWTVLDGSGNSVGAVSYPLSTADGGGVPPGDLSPVASFQVTFGGALDSAHATFSSGAGVIILQADQPMNVDTSYPTCIGFIGGTAETSNMGYGALGAKPSKLFSQAFGIVPDSAQVRMAKPNARKLTSPSA